jgi:hypothetical protein
MSLISRYVTHFSICHSFLDMSPISRYVTHFSICLTVIIGGTDEYYYIDVRGYS